ncbi:ketoacyl-ACP synthase III [Cohnella abietis]|uniref:Beta-ketoacyl-[acyl-carrier-protein] synthase III n=1 Tax=Cohnella abietis TaxID=2507935 RepID=A0A3T1DA79_9BACL|nr:ketoacyl-ACP synthase III [Cohnella abietis]BBI35000.1 3-oxoacyl-[acyl-carrier-protein] synthase 3 protein 2 [Cohnella abietis]
MMTIAHPTENSAFASSARITAIGSYVPEQVITNAEIEQLVDTDNEWIIRRTGIIERHKAASDQFTSHLAIAAVKDLFDRFPATSAEDVDAILVATTTPDMPFPSVASQVQQAIGALNCLAADVSAACAGFVTALQMANGLIMTGVYRKIIVIGAETLTKITDYTDRSTCILFGDGAGAVLVEAAASGAFLSSVATTDGSGGMQVYCNDDHKIVQNGREVYKWALSTVPDGVRKLVQSAGLQLGDLDWFVPHSANLRMIEAICERLDIAPEKALESVVRNGNTSAATIPLALDAAYKANKLQPEQLVALYGFGSGLTQSGLLLRWTLSSN